MCCCLQGRSQTLETLLALTTAELQEVKSKQEHFEARNMLLEGLVGAVAANNLALQAPVKQVHVAVCLKICQTQTILAVFLDDLGHLLSQ